MPKTLCEREYRTRFLPRLCVPTENVGGGEECEDAAFSTVYMPIKGVEQKESLLLAHRCENRYSLQAAESQKAQFCLGWSALMPHTLNCRIEKGYGPILIVSLTKSPLTLGPCSTGPAPLLLQWSSCLLPSTNSVCSPWTSPPAPLY
jgi:hypothetical protein